MKPKNAVRIFSYLLIFSLLLTPWLVGQASGLSRATVNSAKFAWFYKPPKDGNLALLAANFDTFILTKSDETARNQLLALGVSHPVLEYLRFDAIIDPGSCTVTPFQNQVANKAGDFCAISAHHPDWFLLTTSGARISHMSGGSKYYAMNPGSAGWRAFFIDRVNQNQTADPLWDGVFLDNVETTLSFHDQAGEVLAAYPTDASFQAAVMSFLQYLHANFFLPKGKLMFANMVSRGDESEYISYVTDVDGSMHEGWAIDDPNRWRPADVWEKQMALAEQSQALGKPIILVSHGAQNDLELQKFSFGSYLLIANGKAFFRYGSDAAYNVAWLYDNYQFKLGNPLGSRYQSGGAWKRDFANGFVSVDPTSHAVRIELYPGFGSSSSFIDVPAVYWAWSWVERLYKAGITSGCGPNTYCPESTVTRDQMAVFLVRSQKGVSFTPAAAAGSIFSDVPANFWAAAWIEQLARDGITGGCGLKKYCPNAPVTRAEMAVFLLRAEHGSAYQPPAASGSHFTDVPANYWAAAWIEQLAAEGITGGCAAGLYCPDTPVTRAQMAIFLVKSFHLP